MPLLPELNGGLGVEDCYYYLAYDRHVNTNLPTLGTDMYLHIDS